MQLLPTGTMLLIVFREKRALGVFSFEVFGKFEGAAFANRYNVFDCFS